MAGTILWMGCHVYRRLTGIISKVSGVCFAGETRETHTTYPTFLVTAQPYWSGAFELLPSGAKWEVGASFENAMRFQNSHDIFFWAGEARDWQ